MDAICYSKAHIASFITHLLLHHAPGTIIVICSERYGFLRSLLHSINLVRTQTRRSKDTSSSVSQEGYYATLPESDATTQALLTRTLQLLSLTSTAKLVFCTSVQILRAFLATVETNVQPAGETDGKQQQHQKAKPILALVNPVALHRASSSYSAQGISETLAAAVEASVRTGRKLIVAETVDQLRESAEGDEVEMQDVSGEVIGAGKNPRGQNEQYEQERDPWDAQVPVLNGTTKMFGVGGDRTALEKTVKVGVVVRRWCHMQELPT